jgi:hypothetical protein
MQVNYYYFGLKKREIYIYIYIYIYIKAKRLVPTRKQCKLKQENIMVVLKFNSQFKK